MSTLGAMLNRLTPSSRRNSCVSTKSYKSSKSRRSSKSGININEEYIDDDDDERLKSLDELRAALSNAPFLNKLSTRLLMNGTTNDWNNCDENLIFAQPKCAVFVSQLNYYYKKQLVLNRVNINVPQGKIYALLGSRGCGKTTLLKCVLGMLKPKIGEIVVFGNRIDRENSCIPGKKLITKLIIVILQRKKIH